MGPSARPAPREVLYSDFVTLLDSKHVRAARLETGTGRLYFDLHPAEASGAAAVAASSAEEVILASQRQRLEKQYYLKLPPQNDPSVVAKVLAAGVEFGVTKATFLSSLESIFLTALTLWLPLLPLFFIFRRIMESRTNSRQVKKASSSGGPPVTFEDVAGVDGAIEELREVVACLRGASKYTRLSAKMPSGVLLCGPPGTGKTLLARAVAGEAGVPFLSASASEFVEMFVGRGAARIRELFGDARRVAPCVVFIDELDAVGARRGVGYNDERDQTLNQLLTELDGFEGRPGVLLLAATNRAEVLDPALLRPGRISRKVVVPLPDERGRASILRVHLRDVPLATGDTLDMTCTRVARLTQGFSGAELANVVNEAVLLSARRSEEVVGLAELVEGVQRTRFGVNGRGGGPGGLQQVLNSLLAPALARRRGEPVKVRPAV